MKKIVSIILVCLATLLVFSGCAKEEPEEPITMIGNPWSDWNSIEEAEGAVGFSFGVSAVIADTYTASKFRTMTGELLEVIYLDGDNEVRIRKQSGEGEDISGDYNEYTSSTETNLNGATITIFYNAENNAVKQIISYQGYSWSVTSGNIDLGEDFINAICK